jgi:hypothetical protein
MQSRFLDFIDPRFGGGGEFLEIFDPPGWFVGGGFENWEPKVIYPKNQVVTCFSTYIYIYVGTRDLRTL